MRDEAIKRGVFVPVKHSRYQQCSHTQLDSIFSFLEPTDLRRADAVCRRWRSACVYSNAGWVSALSHWNRAVEHSNFARELTHRRISPLRLTALKRVKVPLQWRETDGVFAAISKLPALTQLTVHRMSADQTVLLHGLVATRSQHRPIERRGRVPRR